MEGTTAAAEAAPSGGNTPASSGPLTFEQAFAADAASPAADPSTPASASPEGPAADGTEATPGAERSPYIPRARFDEVNGRLRAAEAQAKALEWAKNFQPESIAEMQQWYGRAKSDLSGFLTSTLLEHENPTALLEAFASAVRQHPTHGQAFKSFVARKLAEQRGQQEPQPDLEYDFGDGRKVPLYSAEQQAKREAWLQQRWNSTLDERLQPFQKDRELHQQKAAEAEGQAWAGDQLKEIGTWEGMDNPDHRALMAQAVAPVLNDPKATRQHVELALERAYRQHILPRLKDASARTAESKLLDSLQQKAHASTGVNPGSAAPSTTTRPKSFTDPSLKW